MKPDTEPPLRHSLDARTLTCSSTGASVIDVTYPEHADFDTHEHDEAYLCLTVRGVYDEWARGSRCRRIGSGQPVVYQTGSRHAVRTGDGPVQIVHVTDPREREWTDGAGPLALGLLWQLSVATRQRIGPTDAERLHVDSLVHELSMPRQESGAADWVESLFDRLRETHREPVLLSDLAREVGRHPAHVARAFRARWQMTAGEVLRRFRVAAAIRRLTETQDPLALVALDCGFADQSHMGRWIRTYIGRTPGQVRSQFGDWELQE